MNGNKFATDQILKKSVEVVKGQILTGWLKSLPNCPAAAPAQIYLPQKARIRVGDGPSFRKLLLSCCIIFGACRCRNLGKGS